MEDGTVFALQPIFGTQQSPINLVDDDCFLITDSLSAVVNPGPYTGELEFDGEHVSIVLKCPNPPTLSFRTVTGKLVKIHYHAPSEHYVNGQQMPAEFHFVHEVIPALSKHTASPPPSTLLVLGVFAKPVPNKKSSKEMDEFRKCLQTLTKGVCEKTSVTFDPETLTAAYKNLSAFYHYRGSLTSGKYAESVSWFVSENHIDVSEDLLKDMEHLDQPTRHLQLLNRRIVLRRKA